jgi:hypothetical protein
MSDHDLDLLERQVDAARQRLGRDIAQLRNPSAIADLKDHVVSRAQALKDDLVHRARDTASSSAQRAWSDLKHRASANPGAVLEIGAGLAWHFVRHPPVTTLLVGLGLSSLLRTPSSSPRAPLVARTMELAESAGDSSLLVQAGARPVSQPPTPAGSGPLPVMDSNVPTTQPVPSGNIGRSSRADAACFCVYQPSGAMLEKHPRPPR